MSDDKRKQAEIDVAVIMTAINIGKMLNVTRCAGVSKITVAALKLAAVMAEKQIEYEKAGKNFMTFPYEEIQAELDFLRADLHLEELIEDQ